MQTYNTYCFNATDVSKTNRHTDIDTHTQTNAHTHTKQTGRQAHTGRSGSTVNTVHGVS